MTSTVDQSRLARYAQVCGFHLGETVPPTYPHVLAWPLTWKVLRAKDFPLPVIGLVHVRNVIDIHCGLRVDAVPRLAVAWTNLRDHPRGRTVDVVTEATVDGAVVWHEVSTYLRRGRDPGERSTSNHREVPTASAVWPVGTAVASAYARVSGDRNPIHTSTLVAKLFGFPRRIAHGMWSKARCLAALEGSLPDRYTVDVAFKLPILLPATVAFSADVTPGGDSSFALHDAHTGRPHLSGTVTARR